MKTKRKTQPLAHAEDSVLLFARLCVCLSVDIFTFKGYDVVVSTFYYLLL